MTGCGCGGAKCRLAAGDERHGSPTRGYVRGCRCDPCKDANSEYQARYRAENADKVRERKARYRSENADKEREYKARYCAENADKERERKARYRAENADKVREYKARYCAENADKDRKHQARYRAENADKVREYKARYAQTPEGKAASRARCRRRRDRKRNAYCGCDTPANLAAIWTLDAGRCAYCDAPGTDYEHVVPLARGGWGCVSNFRIACKSCNSRKGTKPLSVFLAALAASGTPVRPGATNSGLPCPQAAARMATRMLTA